MFGNLFRRLRGIVGSGVSWGATWAAAAAVLHPLALLAGAPGLLGGGLLEDAAAAALFGFCGGSVFAAGLTLTEGRKTLERLSVRAGAFWGVIAGVVAPTVVLGVLGGLPRAVAFLMEAPVVLSAFLALGAGSGAAMTALAKGEHRREIMPQDPVSPKRLTESALLFLGLLIGAEPGSAQSGEIEAVLVHPPVAARFQCSEHALGAEDHVPDALGADCVVVRRTGGRAGNLNSLYSGDGSRNEDWHGRREPLLAPCDGRVAIVSINPATTQPGEVGPGRSSAILFRCGDDEDPEVVQVALIHVREVEVAEGDLVEAGQVVARIGNNGSSYNPHVRVGAFLGELSSDDAVPLQIRFDLAAMGWLPGAGPGGH